MSDATHPIPEDGFQPAIRHAFETYRAGIADGKLCIHEKLHLVADACKVLEELLIGIAGDEGQYQIFRSDVMLVAADFAAIDLPFLGPFVESIVDAQTPTLAAMAVDWLRAQIQKCDH